MHWNITLYIFLNLCNLICILKNVHWIHIIVLNGNYVRYSVILPLLNERISFSRAMQNEIQQIKLILIAFEGGMQICPFIMRSIILMKKPNDTILRSIEFLLCWIKFPYVQVNTTPSPPQPKKTKYLYPKLKKV